MASPRRTLVSALIAAAGLFFAPSARAEPTDPVVIGWWSYFDSTKVDTTTSAQHQVTKYGDPNTYYYEPSGGKGLQENPATLAPAVAWQSIIDYTLSKSNNVSLSAEFTIDTSSDLNQFTQAYFGYALVLLYVPKDKYCDTYRIHIGTVDDGVQAMANGKILGYANLGDTDKYIGMLEVGTNSLVLRPGINEVVLIHEDQQAVQRYVHDVWIEHDGVKIPVAPKNTSFGRVIDAVSMAPLYEATASVTGNGVNDTFVTGPLGFYFFAGLANGTYALTANAAGYKPGTGMATLMLGAAATEVVRTDLALTLGCTCPSGKVCGASGGCLDPCVSSGEFAETCADTKAVCVNHVCAKDLCDTLTCKAGFSCAAGTCVENACSNVCCGAGQICSAGLCVANMCGASCGSGLTCAGGSCVDNCSVVACVDGLTCKAGACIEKCKANPGSCGGTDGGISVPDGGLGGTKAGDGGDGEGSDAFPNKRAAASCGCRVGTSAESTAAALALVGLVAIVSRRARRRK